MLNKKISVLGISLVILAGFTANKAYSLETKQETGLAGGKLVAMGPMGHHPMMFGECPMADKLNLSDEQYSKLWQLKDELKDGLEPKEAELHMAKRHLKMALTSQTVDETKVKEFEDKILALKADLAKLKIDHEIKAMGVLTPEQRKEVNHAMFWSMMGPEMHKCAH